MGAWVVAVAHTGVEVDVEKDEPGNKGPRVHCGEEPVPDATVLNLRRHG